MRIWSPFTFIASFAVVSAVAATACDTSSPDYYGCYDGTYRQYCGSSSYGGSSGYYPPPDTSRPTTCDESFSVEFSVAPDSGDCQLVLSYSSYGLESSSYGGGYGSYDNAIYYFGQLRSESAESEPCDVVSGPTVGRCQRERSRVLLASTTSADSAAIRRENRPHEPERSFFAQLSCARHAGSEVQTVTFGCGPQASPRPATPTTGDAGAEDASDGGDPDGSDGGEGDATPELLH